MAILDWRALWPGYLVISVKGPGLARFLNLTTGQGINFWDLSYYENLVTLKIKPRDLKRLRPLLKKTGCRAKIHQKKGVLFVLLQGKRRKGLALGAVLFCIILYFLSLFVWQINIEGNAGVSTKEICAVLENNGVKVGILKKNLDISELERELLLNIADLKWVGVGVKGVFLNIQVVERRREPPPEIQTTSLVAAKDGLVTDILVLSGEALVTVGDTVQKGQALISGQVKMPEYLNGEAETERILEVKPKGRVQALVWYENYAEAPLYVVQKRKTGNFARFFSMTVKDAEYCYPGPPVSPYRNYEMEKIKRTFAWRNLRLPVELSSICYWEFAVEVLPVSPWEALRQARDHALKELNREFPKGATIKEKFVNDFYFFELGSVGCRVMLETLEDIAVSNISLDS